MTLTIDGVVTHYILSSHPRNRAIVDIKNKNTGELCFIKIRHRLSKFYAVSLVDPVTFEVWAETQVKSASTRIKPIILHQQGDNKNDKSVELRDTSRIGFEWSFMWEGGKYRWVRESRMSSSLECRAVRKTGDICVAQYLPRILKDEYFGIFSLLGYNMLRCELTKPRELELIILMSLMTLLDKSDDGGWKRDPTSKGVQDDIDVYNNNNSSSNENSNDSSSVIASLISYEGPILKKAQHKKYKVELSNDQKLQLMLEKDVRRSQKQIQSDRKHKPLSAPLSTPSASTTNIGSPRLTRQKSACDLNNYNGTTNTDSDVSPTSPTNSGHSSGGRFSRLFSSQSHLKQTNGSSSSSSTVTPKDLTNTSHVDTNKQKAICNSDDDFNNSHADLKQQQQQKRPSQQYKNTCPYYEDHQRSLPTGQVSRITNEFDNLSINSYHQDNPPSVRSIRWNPEPLLSPIQTNAPITNTNKYNSSTQRSPRQQPVFTSQQIHHRSNSQDRRRPQVIGEQRRMSASEYTLYAYHPHQQQRQQQHGYNNIPPPQPTNKYSNRYSTSEYYIYQQQQQYDYYQ